jgi:hypothetical protein
LNFGDVNDDRNWGDFNFGCFTLATKVISRMALIDIKMMNQMTNLTMRTSQPPIKSRLNVNAPVFVPSWEQKA